MTRVWAVRLDEFKGEPIYRVYPKFSRNMVRFWLEIAEEMGEVVRLEIREVRKTKEKRKA